MGAAAADGVSGRPCADIHMVAVVRDHLGLAYGDVEPLASGGAIISV